MISRSSATPIVTAVLATAALLARIPFAGGIMDGTWLRSVVTQTAFGFRISALGPWIDGSLGLPLLMFILASSCASIEVLSRQDNPRFAYAFLVAIVLSGVSTWLFPISIVVPLAVFAIPILGLIVCYQVLFNRRGERKPDTILRAANALARVVLAIAVLDWTQFFVVGGR